MISKEMKRMRIFLAVCIISLPAVFQTADVLRANNDIAYRFTDEDDPDEDDEYFDAYGNRIYDYEYRDQHEKQAKKMQEAASKPFGGAGAQFGSSWATGVKGDKTSTAAESPSPKISAKPELPASPSPKPRVLVS